MVTNEALYATLDILRAHPVMTAPAGAYLTLQAVEGDPHRAQPVLHLPDHGDIPLTPLNLGALGWFLPQAHYDSRTVYGHLPSEHEWWEDAARVVAELAHRTKVPLADPVTREIIPARAHRRTGRPEYTSLPLPSLGVNVQFRRATGGDGLFDATTAARWQVWDDRRDVGTVPDEHGRLTPDTALARWRATSST